MKNKKSLPVRGGNTKSKTTSEGVGTPQEAPKFIARENTYKMSDGGEFYLEVDPAGGKYWRFKYRFARKEKRISLGVFNDVRLAEARERRMDHEALEARRI